MKLIDHGQGLVTLDSFVKLPGGFRLPARTTLLALADGSLVVLAPLPGIGGLRNEILARGPVKAILAPNLLHHHCTRH